MQTASPAQNEHSHRLDHARSPADELFTSLYADLCRMARREVRRNAAYLDMGTSTLVHETWLSVNARHWLSFESPGQFLAYASRAMRGLMIDRVRARGAQKRGGQMIITSLDTHHAEQVDQPELLERIGEALEALSAVEPELAHVVDLKFFCGFTIPEVANMLGVSERTAQRQWVKARALLHRSLQDD